MHGLLVTQLLTRFLEAVYRAANSRSRYTGSGVPTARFAHVSEFWGHAARWDPVKPPRQYVEMTATISTFAPAMPGVPQRKRDLHRDVRRSIPQIEAQMKKRGHGVGPTTIDALLAYTAGQMVVRLADDTTPYAYAGLYHSIVRNSIPLFVKQDYHLDQVVSALQKNHDADAMEARVIARLLPMPEDYLLKFLRETGLYNVFDPNLLKRVAPRFALQVDGDDGTSIQPLGSCRYLDGDIWVAVRVGETERVVSRFLDLSDPEDLQAEREGLRTDAERLYGGAAVIAEYDQTLCLLDRTPILDSAAIRERVYRDSAPKPESARRRRRQRGAPAPDMQQMFITQYIFDSKVEGVHVSKEHIEIHNVGGIVNVKATLQNVKQAIGGGGLAKERRAELERLIDELEVALAKVPPAHAADAGRVAKSAELVVEEAVKEQPDRSFLKISAEGLKQAAEAVKDVAPAVLSVVGKLVPFLTV